MTLLLGFAAVNTGNNLLYLLVSALLGFMAVSGLLGQQNLQRLQVRVLPVDDLFASLPARVEVELENRRRWLPAFLIRVEVGGNSSLYPILGAGQKQTTSLNLTFPSRGYQQLPPLWVRSCFPINFFVRSRYLPGARQLLVFPQPKAAELPLVDGGRQQARQLESSLPGIDGELRSVDSYQQSDPLKSIHWKLSARHDELKVKRLSRLGAPSVLIDLNALSGHLETRLSQATYLVERLYQQQTAVGLKLEGRLLPPVHGRSQRYKLLTELALYDRR